MCQNTEYSDTRLLASGAQEAAAQPPPWQPMAHETDTDTNMWMLVLQRGASSCNGGCSSGYQEATIIWRMIADGPHKVLAHAMRFAIGY